MRGKNWYLFNIDSRPLLFLTIYTQKFSTSSFYLWKFCNIKKNLNTVCTHHIFKFIVSIFTKKKLIFFLKLLTSISLISLSFDNIRQTFGILSISFTNIFNPIFMFNLTLNFCENRGEWPKSDRDPNRIFLI